MASGVLQRSGQWLGDQLRKLEAELVARRTEISMNNARIIEGNERAKRITDPAKRALAIDGYSKLAKNQARIAAAYRTFGSKVQSIAQSVRQWLSANGYTTGVNGLGAIPLVPAAVVALLAGGTVAWVANDHLKRENSLATKAIGEKGRVLDGVLGGQLSPADGARLMASIDRSVEQQRGPDPLGLANLAEAIVPLGILAAALVLGPPLINAFGRKAR